MTGSRDRRSVTGHVILGHIADRLPMLEISCNQRDRPARPNTSAHDPTTSTRLLFSLLHDMAAQPEIKRLADYPTLAARPRARIAVGDTASGSSPRWSETLQSPGRSTTPIIRMSARLIENTAASNTGT
jgi:hypothetical protein